MKKAIIVLSLFVSFTFISCEEKSIENHDVEIQTIDKDEVEEPEDRY